MAALYQTGFTFSTTLETELLSESLAGFSSTLGSFFLFSFWHSAKKNNLAAWVKLQTTLLVLVILPPGGRCATCQLRELLEE